jgi:hypothetical protein
VSILAIEAIERLGGISSIRQRKNPSATPAKAGIQVRFVKRRVIG